MKDCANCQAEIKPVKFGEPLTVLADGNPEPSITDSSVRACVETRRRVCIKCGSEVPQTKYKSGYTREIYKGIVQAYTKVWEPMLAYGMSQFKLAATLKIDVKDAEALIEKYFKTFPKIGGKLTALGRFAVRNGYIMTLAPYFRKRWYPLWEQVKSSIDYHINGIEHNALLGSIERTGKNTPIQGGSADMTKLALVLIRKHINDNGLRDVVKLVMQVHDQITTLSNKEYAGKWSVTLTELMEMAAKVIIPSGLLKAETNVTERWSK